MLGAGEHRSVRIEYTEARSGAGNNADRPRQGMSFRRSRKLPCPRGTATGKLFLGRGTRLRSMLTAVILVKSSRVGLSTLGPKLADVEGVAEVYTVTGEWDFVAIVRVREHDDLAKVVTQGLTKLEEIERTQTMVAFQQFSAHDLEAMFGLGVEDKRA
jgi:DNA-binding Lrp family transcriptional regulator